MLMVVLVLRGLMGTAMAAGVLPMLPAASSAASASAGHGSDHTEHGMSSAQQAQTAVQPTCHGILPDSAQGCEVHSHPAACSACDICHSAMLTPPGADLHAPPPTSAVQPTATAPFASALAAQAIKPPIS